jgi:outer membrane protein assembly factor BamB
MGYWKQVARSFAIADGIAFAGDAALAMETGEVIWRHKSPSGFDSPSLVQVGSSHCFALAGCLLEVKTGKEPLGPALFKGSWAYHEGRRMAMVNGPGNGKHGHTYTIFEFNDGRPQKLTSVLAYTHHGSPILQGNHFFHYDAHGHVFKQKAWQAPPCFFCLEIPSGHRLWETPMTEGSLSLLDPFSSPILADGKIIGKAGKAFWMLDVASGKRLGVAKGVFGLYCSPAFWNGYLFLRKGDGGVICFDLAAKR